jgi:hypothetical protein
LKDETERTWALKKRKKQTHTNLVNLSFISQTHNMLNPIPELNQESQFPNKLNVEEWNWKSSINLKKNQSKKK